VARIDLQLTDEAFLALTPREFGLLEERSLVRDRTTQEMVGKLLATVVNYSYLAPKEARAPWDFGLPLVETPPAARRPRMTKARRRQVASNIRMHFGQLAKTPPSE
jgi:hypothetical protein